MVEDLDQCDVHESFVAFEEDQVRVIDDEGEVLFVLVDHQMSFDEEVEKKKFLVLCCTVLVGTTEFQIILNDENHKLQQS